MKVGKYSAPLQKLYLYELKCLELRIFDLNLRKSVMPSKKKSQWIKISFLISTEKGYVLYFLNAIRYLVFRDKNRFSHVLSAKTLVLWADNFT